jgi:hypothetical protein
MTYSTWLALLGACLLISFTPGAGAVNTMNNALRVGFRRAIWGILGQQAALLIQLMIVAAGLGLVISRSPAAFAVIRYCGAAYLVYLGIQQIRAGRRAPPLRSNFAAVRPRSARCSCAGSGSICSIQRRSSFSSPLCPALCARERSLGAVRADRRDHRGGRCSGDVGLLRGRWQVLRPLRRDRAGPTRTWLGSLACCLSASA